MFAQKLCSECGLCCDGSLLADVELRDTVESTELEAMGMVIEEEDGRELMLQPCKGLRGTKCRIYQHRPECCRTFECQLLRELNQQMISLNQALHEVQLARKVLKSKTELSRKNEVIKRFLES